MTPLLASLGESLLLHRSKFSRKMTSCSGLLCCLCLGRTLLNPICHFIMARTCGLLSRPGLGSRMLAKNYISWSNSMTSRCLLNAPAFEQAHEIHALSKELEYFSCVLLDKF